MSGVEGDPSVSIKPMPLGELVYMPAEFICFSADITPHDDECADCVPVSIYDEIEEAYLTIPGEDGISL